MVYALGLSTIDTDLRSMRIATYTGNSLIIGAVLMLGSFFISYELIQKERQVSFVGPVREFVELKNERFENLNYELMSIESFFLSSTGVNEKEFGSFIEPIFEQSIILNTILYYNAQAATLQLKQPTYWHSFNGELPVELHDLEENLSSINPQHMRTSEAITSPIITGKQDTVIPVIYKMQNNEGVVVLLIDFKRAMRSILNHEVSKEFFVYNEEEKVIFKNIEESTLGSQYFEEDLFFFDDYWKVRINDKNSFRYYLYYLIPMFTLLFSIFLFYLFRYSVRLNKANKETDEAITKLQFAQEKIIESEKISAMGGLVAGISHEVNTPVGISITSASHQRDLLDELKQDFENGVLDSEKFEDFLSASYDMVDMTLKNMQRASKLVASFKRVAVINADEAADIEHINLNTLIDDFIADYALHNSAQIIQFSTRFPETSWVNTYPAVITQILSHLTSNTLLHAFKPGQRQCDVLIAIRAYKDGYAVRFSDNGVGVPQHELRKITEPFFTTKRGAGNAGLGLPVVYNLVRSKLKSDFNHGSVEGQGLWVSFTVQNLEKE